MMEQARIIVKLASLVFMMNHSYSVLFREYLPGNLRPSTGGENCANWFIITLDCGGLSLKRMVQQLKQKFSG